jgi:homoserine O-acetyltransferase/O-succinyltransferase
MKIYKYQQPFILENGNVLPEVEIAYHTYGTLNTAKNNVVWVCHALTANSDVVDWWKGVVGSGNVINPERYFIVCANILGSCYGSTGPLSQQQNGTPYYNNFPLVTIRDMVKAHMLLRQHLGIEKIYLLIGGSMGGYQAMEWCTMESDGIENLFLLATSAAESAWGIAIHTAQRLSIHADDTFYTPSPTAGTKGLKAARAIGMLTYRNYGIMVQQQNDADAEKLDDFKASSYIIYQGEKLVQRFNVYSYYTLTKSMDNHNISRGRGGNLSVVLKTIKQRTLIIGINSDILCPLSEQRFLATHIPLATLIEIDSNYGHDGFMVEHKIISQHLAEWLGANPVLGYGASI